MQEKKQLEQNKWIIKHLQSVYDLRTFFFSFPLNFINNRFRSTDTEDYMQITLAAQTSVGPPTPPPLPPQIPIVASGKIPPPPPPQDTATRKQQQPLSAISIQDLNSVQVMFIDLTRKIQHFD